MKQVDQVVALHEKEYDRAWLLAAIIAECSLRLRELDTAVRMLAELDATGPDRLIARIQRQQKRTKT